MVSRGREIGYWVRVVFSVRYSVFGGLVARYWLFVIELLGRMEDGVLLPTLIVVFHRLGKEKPLCHPDEPSFGRQARDLREFERFLMCPHPRPSGHPLSKKGEGGVQGRGYFVARYWLFVIERRIDCWLLCVEY